MLWLIFMLTFSSAGEADLYVATNPNTVFASKTACESFLEGREFTIEDLPEETRGDDGLYIRVGCMSTDDLRNLGYLSPAGSAI